MKTEMHCWICRTDAAHCRCGDDTNHRVRVADDTNRISYPPPDCDLTASGGVGLMRLGHEEIISR